MDMPDKSKFGTAAPAAAAAPADRPGEQAAKEFFPEIATVRAALEAAQIGVWSWDIATDTVTWSSNLESIHGMPAGSFDDTYACFIANIHRDDRAAVEALLKEALRTRSPFRARYRAPHQDGRDECWVEATGTVAVADGAPARIVGLCYDVTGRVNLENELRSRAKHQEALAQLGERALAEPDLERLLNDAVSTVALSLSVDFVQILELLPGGSELVLRAGFGWKSDLVGTILTTTAPNSFARFTLDSSVPVIIADFADRDQVRSRALFEGAQLHQRHERHHRRPRRPRLWHSRRLHPQEAAVQRAGAVVPRRRRQSSCRRHPAPPARSSATN